MSCSQPKQRFQAARKHSRRPELLKSTIEEHKLEEYREKSFEEILARICHLCENRPFHGELAVYDLVSDICNFNQVLVPKVYGAGSGPRKAFQLLGLTPRIQRIGRFRFPSVEIYEVKAAFQAKTIPLPSHLQNSEDGDAFETFLCKWQKTVMHPKSS